MKKGLSKLLATFFYIGCLPGARGTYASVVTTALYYLVFGTFHQITPTIHLGLICLISIAGGVVANEVGKQLGQKDPQIVVIDEVAGQLLTFLFLPITWVNLFLGTMLFRLFDIWKPYPIRKSERLGYGVGIMADDLIAGIYANLILQIAGWLLTKEYPGATSWLNL
jgi:phosphatidylglycerophosphatase A